MPISNKMRKRRINIYLITTGIIGALFLVTLIGKLQGNFDKVFNTQTKSITHNYFEYSAVSLKEAQKKRQNRIIFCGYNLVHYLFGARQGN